MLTYTYMKIPPLDQLLGQALSLTLAYFLPIRPLIYAVLFLFFMDWVLGVWRSVKNRRKLTSYRFRKSVSKITTYIICIMSTWVMQKTFLPDWIPIAHLAAGYIAWTELVSIYENASDISNKELIKNLLALLKKNFDNYFKPQ
jgi:phage-related holin